MAHLFDGLGADVAGSLVAVLGTAVYPAQQGTSTHPAAHLRQLAAAQYGARFSAATARFYNSSLARRAGSGVAQQRAGMRARARAATGAPTCMRAYGAALVLRRAHRAAHAAVLSGDGFVRVLTGWAAPFALNHTAHSPLPDTPQMQHMVTVAARPHLLKLFDSVAAHKALQSAFI